MSQQVLKKLFPSRSPEELVHLSREELLQIIRNDELDRSWEQIPGPRSDDQGSPEEDEGELEEPDKFRQQSTSVYDDVNSYSLSIDRERSSLGISSVRSILRLIVDLSPAVKMKLFQDLRLSAQSLKHQAMSADSPSSVRSSHSQTAVDENACIDAYFATFHYITPMVDELRFRRLHASGRRKDSAWLALHSMVLAVGSIAATSQRDNESSRRYYERARRVIGLEIFGSGSIDSLQALCLLGGYYLHFRNTPNMANSVLGAAFRMAAALGLHRESDPGGAQTAIEPEDSVSPIETRRRTWWSLFCMDTWASMTLGRPIFGRWDPASMDVQLPKTNTGEFPVLSLRASVEFCRLATSVQDRFAQGDTLSVADMIEYDSALARWESQTQATIVPWEGPCPHSVFVAREFMKNRNMNLLILLYRPVLLRHAAQQTPFECLSDGDRNAILRCEALSIEAINLITTSVVSDPVWLWGSTWYLYQACFVPLLMIIAFPNRPETALCQRAIENALEAFKTFMGMEGHGTAERSHDVVKSIYEASKSVLEPNAGDRQLQGPPDLSSLDMGLWDLATAGFEYDYAWESMLNWDTTLTG